MKVLLIDVDSKIPNLALMKISAYHKSKSDIVGFDINNPDLIYASIIFKKNKNNVNHLKYFYPNAKIIIGGSGYDLNIKLPNEIEFMYPDYDLYPNIKYSLGYTTRGCNRNCYFCIVPQKEGNFKYWQHPSKFYNDDFNEIVFLDNNILFDKNRFYEIIDFCEQHCLTCWFTQGLDIRLIDEKVVKYLLKVKHKMINFAWDNINNPSENIIKEKIQLLKNNGFTNRDLRTNVSFYIYINNDNEFDSGLYRCKTLKNLDVNSFVMFNINIERTRRIKDLQRWANRRWLYWSIEFEEYNKIYKINRDLNQVKFR